MIITELTLKNFGKFTKKEILFFEGMNLIYGENGAGKSTIHTFLEGMLYGIERRRGRGAANDVYSRYEPWENPNYYAGILRFICGGRKFTLERHFDKYAKSVKLFCEDDGEELSVEQGDLEMLLGGMRKEEYGNTIAAAQMKIATEPILAAELKNYAANYETIGNDNIDLEDAFAQLKERKKEVDKEIRQLEENRNVKRREIELELSYVYGDLKKIEAELEQVCQEWKQNTQKQEREEQKSKDMFRIKIRERRKKYLLQVAGILGLQIFFILVFGWPWNWLVAGGLALVEGVYIWKGMKGEKEKKKEIKIFEEIIKEKKWRMEKLKEDYRDKQIYYENLQEQMQELDEFDQEWKEQEKQKEALILAEETLRKVSKEMQEMLSRHLNDTVSAIFKEITGGKYEKVWVDEKLHMHLLENGRSITMDRVSRGTVEQLYFALRMAAAEVLYEEEYPVILDDTFAYYDEIRLEKTLQWLIKNRKQVLIFTCQKREEEILKRLKAIYHRIEI